MNRKIIAFTMCMLLALSGVSCLAEAEPDLNRYVVTYATGELPSMDAWDAVLSLPGVVGCSVYGVAEHMIPDASALLLVFDSGLEAEGLARLDAEVLEGAKLDELAAGECLLPAYTADVLELGVGDALAIEGAVGERKELIIGGLYSTIGDEAPYDEWNAVLVRQADFLDIVGRDRAALVNVSEIILTEDANPDAFTQTASEILGEQGVFFLTYAQYQELMNDASGEGGVYQGAPTFFDGTDFDGNALEENLLVEGGVTMINIWATFCSPCISEMPELEALSQAYQEAGAAFRIIGVCGDLHDAAGHLSEENVSLGRDILTATGVTYLNIIPGPQLRADLLGTLEYFPTTLFVDDTGATLRTVIGSHSKEEWREIIDALLS